MMPYYSRFLSFTGSRNTPLITAEKMEKSVTVSNGARPAYEEKEDALR